MGNDRRRHGNGQPPNGYSRYHEHPCRPGQAVQNHQNALWAYGLAILRGSRADGRRSRRFGILHLFLYGRLWRGHARPHSRGQLNQRTRTSSVSYFHTEEQERRFFHALCYAVGQKKPCSMRLCGRVFKAARCLYLFPQKRCFTA